MRHIFAFNNFMTTKWSNNNSHKCNPWYIDSGGARILKGFNYTVQHLRRFSEKFSITKLDSLDIYVNPISNGDPLKTITSLPVSTTDWPFITERKSSRLHRRSGGLTWIIHKYYISQYL